MGRRDRMRFWMAGIVLCDLALQEHVNESLVCQLERVNFSGDRDVQVHLIQAGYVHKVDLLDLVEREVRWIEKGRGQRDNALQGVC